MMFNETFYVKKLNGIYVCWHYPTGLKATVAVSKERLEELIGERWEKHKAQLQQL